MGGLVFAGPSVPGGGPRRRAAAAPGAAALAGLLSAPGPAPLPGRVAAGGRRLAPAVGLAPPGAVVPPLGRVDAFGPGGPEKTLVAMVTLHLGWGVVSCCQGYQGAAVAVHPLVSEQTLGSRAYIDLR